MPGEVEDARDRDETVVVADVGNSGVKYSVCRRLPPEPVGSPRLWPLAGEPAWPDLPEGPMDWFLCSVHRERLAALRDALAEQRPDDRLHCLDHRWCPLILDVESPERTGMDRLCAAVAASSRLPGTPTVVVDAGTAVTVDLVTADGTFRGGAILPGRGLMAAALDAGTDALPHADLLPDDVPDVVGRTSEGAIASGITWGLLGAVRELVGRLTDEAGGQANVLVTGGGGLWLARQAGWENGYAPDLVLRGVVLTAARWQFQPPR